MPESTDPELDALTENYQRNREWAKRQNYTTKLSPQEEKDFQGWVWKNQVPYNMKWPPDQAMQDYDMRGFWKALQSGDPRAASAIDPNDNRIHYPDMWKTPYHRTFSNQSIYALPDAPQWRDDRLYDKSGKLLFDDKIQQ